MKMRATRSRTGRNAFTLVELLIVIIIIGILAGAMLMLRASGADKAEAAKIISDLRSLKAAVAIYQVDNGAGAPLPGSADLEKHMDRKIPSGYDIADNGHYWFVFYNDSDLGGSGVAKSLANSAKDVGLLKSTVVSPDIEFYTGTDAEDSVYLRVH